MDLNKSIQKAKRKNLVRIVCISILSISIILGVLIFTLDKVATSNYRKLNDTLFNYQTIASPNTQIDSQVIANSSFLGGEVVTNQSKNIDGYMVPWTSLRNKYDILKSSIDYNELTPSWYHSAKISYEYNRQTKQKVATFYNPTIEDYYDNVKNELTEVTQMDNTVAEMAISFDKPYTYSEVKEMIPENLNIVWLYLFSEERDESKGPAGISVYGFQLSKDSDNKAIDEEADKDSFFSSFETHFLQMDNQKAAKFIRENKDKDVDELPVLGVMVTGQTQNFAELEDQAFVRGSSVGVTVPVVPYIEPER
ncbi:anti sigma factor C-terminal domain-containing protein [Enterococcus sp. AZ109]|uniref:anti sigma factor C-terminal domain-containing protein n=1 Tax=Enterococcus sp. AZ109 TaxID=2774634 RepID=UPI003F23CAA7